MNKIFKKILSTGLVLSMVLPYMGNTAMALGEDDITNPLYKKVNFLNKEELKAYIDRENIKADKDGFYELKYNDNMPDALKAEYKTKNQTGFYADKDDTNRVFQIPESVDFIMKNTNIKAKHISIPKNVDYVLSSDLDSYRIKYFNKNMEFEPNEKYVFENPDNPYTYKSFIYNEIGDEIRGFSKEGRQTFKELKKLSFPKMNEDGVFITKIGVNAFSNIGLTDVDLGSIKEVDDNAFANNKIKNIDTSNLTVIGEDTFKNNKLKEDIKPIIEEKKESKPVEKAEDKPSEKPSKDEDKTISKDEDKTEIKKVEPKKEVKSEVKNQPKNEEPKKEESKNKEVQKEHKDTKVLDMRSYKLTKPKELTKKEYKDLIKYHKEPKKNKSLLDFLFEPASAEESVSEKDGYKIDTADMSWILDDQTSKNIQHIDLTNSNGGSFFVRAKLNISLMSKVDYKPGDIQIKVPRYIFKTREDINTGELNMAVPELPDKSQPFAYLNNGDEYIIVNTKSIAATTQAVFEFTIKGLSPSNIKDFSTGYKSDPFNALVEVTTNKGDKILKRTNGVQAEIDTRARLDSIQQNALYTFEKYNDRVFPKELKPENDKDYIYVAWPSSITTEATQPYTVDVTARFNEGPNNKGAILLGYSAGGKQVKTSDPTIKNVFDGYVANASASHANVTYYVAYPRSNFKNFESYMLSNTVEYTLTSKDDKEVTKKSATQSLEYRPIIFKPQKGHFLAKKRRKGEYKYHMNQLRNGKDVTLTYAIENHGFGFLWTYDGSSDPTKPESYNKKDYTLTTEDYSLELQDIKDLTVDDYSFESISLSKPALYNYEPAPTNGYYLTEKDGHIEHQKRSEGEWSYVDNKKDSVDIDIYGKIGDTWKKYGVYKSETGTIIPQNGAKINGSSLIFPENVIAFKTELSTKLGGVVYNSYPVVKLKASPKVKERIESLFKATDIPIAKVYNEARMDAILNGKKIVVNKTGAANTMSGFSYGSKLEKSLTYENQPKDRRVKLFYMGRVVTQTNVDEESDLKDAKAAGLFEEQTSAIWHDLLPKGVIPDTRSIKARSGDRITKIEFIENYKNSGRNLLKIHVNLKPLYKYESSELSSIIGTTGLYDNPLITFYAYYTWESLTDWGKVVENNIAFESNVDSLGSIEGLKGEPDNPRAGKNKFSAKATTGIEDIMTNLNPDHDKESFLYAKATDIIAADTYAITSFRKTVDVNSEAKYDDGKLNEKPKNVYENGRYSYRLSIQNTDATSSDSIIFYDSLESYKPSQETPDYKDTQWQGKLINVDVSQLKNKGIKPVIYYSTKENLTLGNPDNKADNDLTRSDIWTKTRPMDKKITAIAVDASRKEDGSPFELDANESLSLNINMRAPKIENLADNHGDMEQWFDKNLTVDETETALNGGAHAYNSASMSFVSISKKDKLRTPDLLVRNEYTKVGLKPFKIKINKTFDDGNNRDGVRPNDPHGVTINLLADGEMVDTTKIGDFNNWSYDFGSKPYYSDKGEKIDYTFTEEGGNNNIPEGSYGYTLSFTEDDQSLKDEGYTLFDLVNTRQPEMVEMKGEKTWDDNAQNPDTIRVDLLGNNQVVNSKYVKPDKDGKWTYNFGKVYKYENGKPIKYTIREDYLEGFRPKYNENNINIHNEIYPYGDLKVTKKLKNATPKARENEFKFKLLIKDSENRDDNSLYDYEKSNGQTGKISNGNDFIIKGDESITIKNIKSTDRCTVSEYEKKGFKEVESQADGKSALIKSGQTSEIKFINKYDTNTEVKIDAKKILTGRKLENNQFIFDIIDETGKIIKSGFNNSDGDILFGVFKFGIKDLSKPHMYTIKERIPNNETSEGQTSELGYSYDPREFKVNILLVDNGDGTMTPTTTIVGDNKIKFENSYKAKGTLNLTAKKVIRGGFTPKDDQFKFRLIDMSDNEEICIVSNEENGDIKFDPLEFNQEDIGKTFRYKAVEIDEENPDVNYDKSSIEYEATVLDNGDGHLSFDVKVTDTKTDDLNNDPTNPLLVNQYKPGKLEVRKIVEGDKNAEFTFKVKFTGEDDLVPDGTLNVQKGSTKNLFKIMFEDANGVLSDPMLTNKEDGDYVLKFKDNNLGKLNTLWLIDGVENPNKTSFTNESEIHYKVEGGKVASMYVSDEEVPGSPRIDIPESVLNSGMLKFVEDACPVHHVTLDPQPFKGETDLISYSTLSNTLGITEGNLRSTSDKWLEYNIDDKHLYLAKQPIKDSISFDHLFDKGIVYSDENVAKNEGQPIIDYRGHTYRQADPIEINGKKYRVRLLNGIDIGGQKPWKLNIQNNPDLDIGNNQDMLQNSEYNKLIFSISESYPDQNGIKTPAWYRGIDGFGSTPYWVKPDTKGKYSFKDLTGVNEITETKAEWIQETHKTKSMNVSLVRTYEETKQFSPILTMTNSDSKESFNLWRPVLEEIVENPEPTFKGETNLISYKDLVDQTGLTAGTLTSTDNPEISQDKKASVDKWLEYKINGKTLYVSKLPVKYDLSLKDLYDKGLIYSDKSLNDQYSKIKNPQDLNDEPPTVRNRKNDIYTPANPIEINGKKYRVRLLSGVDDTLYAKWIPSNRKYQKEYNKNSEYDQILKGVNYNDLTIGQNIGSKNFIQEWSDDNDDVLTAGSSNDHNERVKTGYTATSKELGFRPVLEEIEQGSRYYGPLTNDCFVDLNKIQEFISLTGEEIPEESNQGWMHFSYGQVEYYISKKPFKGIGSFRYTSELLEKTINDKRYKLVMLGTSDPFFIASKDHLINRGDLQQQSASYLVFIRTSSEE